MTKGNGELSAAQKKIAQAAPPFDKITRADFKKLRATGSRKPKQ